MVAMRVLTVLLSVLLVANARVLLRRSADVSTEASVVEASTTEPPVFSTTEEPIITTSEEPVFSTTEEPVFSTTEEPVFSTTEEPVFSTTEEPVFSTTEEPVYSTTAQPDYSTINYDYLWNDTYTVDYNPQVYSIQCGITQETVLYLDSFGDFGTFDISSNTTENSDYSNYQDCSIQFVTGYTPVWLYVYLEEFDLENSTQCYYDYLCIKGAKFCGRASYPSYLSYGVPANQTFTIKFHTDGSVTSSGVRARVYSYATSSEVSSYEPYGIVSNPNQINNYRDVSPQDYVDYCTDVNNPIYSVTAADNSYQTTQDYSTTDSPNGGTEQVIQCYEGVSENYYYIQSNSNNYYGSGDTYYAYNQFYNNNNNNNNYVFYTPNFGAGNYGNNTSCKVHFYTSSVAQRLTVSYSDFDVESASNCIFDYLCVNGVNFCSSWAQGRTFTYNIPAYNTFTLDFKTDSSYVRPGVRAYLSFVDSYSTYNYEAIRGDGSQESTVEYSYTDSYSYQDRCSDSYSEPTTVYYPPYVTDYYNSYSTDSGDSNNYREVVIESIEKNIDTAEVYLQVAKDLVQELPSED